MPMKRMYFLFLVLFLLSACHHEELCFHHPHKARVKVNVDWSRFKKEEPTGMTVMVFPQDGGATLSSVGHGLDYATFDLLEGDYHTLTFNQSTSEFGSFEFRHMDSFHDAEVVSSTIGSRWYKSRAKDERLAADPEWFAVDSEAEAPVEPT